MEGGSPSCCAGARGSTIRTTPAPPSGTATTRTMSTPTLASVPAVSPPQHPSPSEPLEGIPAGVLEGSRPAPVIGDPRWQGLPRANGRTIRTTPAHCPTAPGLGCLVGFCWALTPTTLPPRHEQPAAPAPAAGPRCAPPAGSARRGRQSDRAATAAPSGDQPPPAGARCRWREGKPWETGRGSGLEPPQGASTTNPIRFHCPSPPRQRERSNGLYLHGERPWKSGASQGPTPGRPLAARPPGASQHRHRAHSRRRQRPRVERLIERLRQRAGVSTQAVPWACVAIPIPACRSAAAEQRPGAARTARIITIPHSLAWPRPPGFIQALGGLMLGQIALFFVQLAAARPLALAPPYPSTSALSASSALAMAACA